MKGFQKFLLIILLMQLHLPKLFAQEDLLNLIDEEPPKKEFVTNAFKSTRVVTCQSMEHLGPGVLDFRILHRFGRVNTGAYGAYGLDQATMRLGLDYGISKRLMVGIGRSTINKESDAFAKYRLIWQSKGKGSIPFSVLLSSSIMRDGLKFQETDQQNFESSRYSFCNQIILGSKISSAFSFQISPTLVHRNLVNTEEEHHDIYSLGMGARLKLTKRIALTAEYYYNMKDQLDPGYYNPFSIGFDIETGGHVFQLHFTNSVGLNERSYIVATDGKWEKGDIHFGFNLSRVFTVVKPKEFRKEN